MVLSKIRERNGAKRPASGARKMIHQVLTSRFAMLVEITPGEYERSPFGGYAFTGSCVIWCASRGLAGWHIWGRPDEDETRTLLRCMDQYVRMDVGFSVVADTRGVEVVNTAALPLLASWVFENRRELKRRIRVQANVIRRDPIGFLLMGIVSSVGDIHPLKTFVDPLEAFRLVAPDTGAELCAQVEEIVAQVRGVPREIQSLRTLLARQPRTSIAEAARALSTSARSLQRILERHGSSFHDEQTTARFELAQSLLRGSDVKISDVAARAGWSTSTLTSIFRAKTGHTPADWRLKNRA